MRNTPSSLPIVIAVAILFIALGTYRWVTPHGLARMVTPRGTAKIRLIRGPNGDIAGEIYTGPRVDYHPRN